MVTRTLLQVDVEAIAGASEQIIVASTQCRCKLVEAMRAEAAAIERHTMFVSRYERLEAELLEDVSTTT
jgi:hypothetical protein